MRKEFLQKNRVGRAGARTAFLQKGWRKKDYIPFCERKWAGQESNLRPHRCKRCIITARPPAQYFLFLVKRKMLTKKKAPYVFSCFTVLSQLKPLGKSLNINQVY